MSSHFCPTGNVLLYFPYSPDWQCPPVLARLAVSSNIRQSGRALLTGKHPGPDQARGRRHLESESHFLPSSGFSKGWISLLLSCWGNKCSPFPSAQPQKFLGQLINMVMLKVKYTANIVYLLYHGNRGSNMEECCRCCSLLSPST